MIRKFLGLPKLKESVGVKRKRKWEDRRERNFPILEKKIMENIMSFLEPQDLKSARLVEKHWNATAGPELAAKTRLVLKIGKISKRKLQIITNPNPGLLMPIKGLNFKVTKAHPHSSFCDKRKLKQRVNLRAVWALAQENQSKMVHSIMEMFSSSLETLEIDFDPDTLKNAPFLYFPPPELKFPALKKFSIPTQYHEFNQTEFLYRFWDFCANAPLLQTLGVQSVLPQIFGRMSQNLELIPKFSGIEVNSELDAEGICILGDFPPRTFKILRFKNMDRVSLANRKLEKLLEDNKETLVELELWNFRGRSTTSVLKIPDSLPKLRELKIQLCSHGIQPKDATRFDYPNNFPNLKRFYFDLNLKSLNRMRKEVRIMAVNQIFATYFPQGIECKSLHRLRMDYLKFFKVYEDNEDYEIYKNFYWYIKVFPAAKWESLKPNCTDDDNEELNEEPEEVDLDLEFELDLDLDFSFNILFDDIPVSSKEEEQCFKTW